MNPTNSTKTSKKEMGAKAGAPISVGSSCFTCGTSRVNLFTNQVISHE